MSAVGAPFAIISLCFMLASCAMGPDAVLLDAFEAPSSNPVVAAETAIEPVTETPILSSDEAIGTSAPKVAETGLMDEATRKETLAYLMSLSHSRRGRAPVSPTSGLGDTQDLRLTQAEDRLTQLPASHGDAEN